ncbi:MAG: A/G-specific adenine glycosylase [Lachnospiraceae bacterium]|nr:A/G-specific adenine glycosylase [Lachnospiraceae bacterium]
MEKQSEALRVLSQVSEPLLAWFWENGRELPFRIGRNAYRIWVSEIMLQQTRIEAVKPYFERFMQELPDIHSLAECEDERLMKLWEGLGYYSRARNLKKAAEVLVEKYGGKMPADYEALKSLPGIGPYTAGAIASIAFGIPVPAVDGNVLRVVSRLCRDDRDIMKTSTRKDVEMLLKETMSKEHPGAYNEAVMEIGETVCIPNGRPLCERCPMAAWCLAHRDHVEEQYPVRIVKKERRIEERTIFLLEYQGGLILEQRPNHGLLAGLYELPGTTGHLDEEACKVYLQQKFTQLDVDHLSYKRLLAAKHIFSHVEWHMIGYHVVLPKMDPAPAIVAGKTELADVYPLPNAFRAYLKAWNEGI